MTDPAVRVIVAEDESLIRIDLEEMLSELGYNVVGTASDGAAAVQLVQSLKPDVAIVDIKMPVLDGLSAAEQISDIGGTAVVMLTAFSQREFVDRAREAGVMAFLIKPVNASDLTPAVELARARFAEKLTLESEIQSLGDRLEARKLIDRAKGILQDKYTLNETDAFRWLQKAAMDGRKSMTDVAKLVIADAD